MRGINSAENAGTKEGLGWLGFFGTILQRGPACIKRLMHAVLTINDLTRHLVCFFFPTDGGETFVSRPDPVRVRTYKNKHRLHDSP